MISPFKSHKNSFFFFFFVGCILLHLYNQQRLPPIKHARTRHILPPFNQTICISERNEISVACESVEEENGRQGVKSVNVENPSQKKKLFFTGV